MPAVSTAQRQAAVIAKHHPEDLYPRNAGLAAMTLKQLAEFTSTQHKGLPKHVKKGKGKR